ncbi:MAG TPA: hypothetical protein DIW47_10690 [Bacteroidetes bacterium]|nr:hypothetical protein [Bacteroidota bacterium]
MEQKFLKKNVYISGKAYSMKPLLFSLLIFLSLSVWAQPDKREITIRQQLAGLWQLDISEDSSVWENDWFNVPFVQFLEGDRLAIISGGSLIVGIYDIAFSSRDTFLLTDNFQAKIKSSRINGNWKVNEIRIDEPEGHTDKLIRIGVSIPLPIDLSNSYDYELDGTWTIYPPLSALPEGDLELNEDFRFKWDSLGTGTWNLDSIQARIHFQTPSGLFVYDILKVSHLVLVLRPQHSKNPDSVVTFGTIVNNPIDEEKSRIQDSVRAADSLAAAFQLMNAIMAAELMVDPSKFGREFMGSWEAFVANSPETQAFTLIWNEDGTLILKKGKKDKKYTWELISVEEEFVRLKLTRSGKEELSLMVFFADHVHHEITLIDPFTGKLESFLLRRSQ